ncbi:carboxypeptidase B-like [Amphiura filiformis]|uniref:carboxypeptidase B-like n=1 Tax=Amphiura filiformis TaxID=82378 RepID=UPI003B216E41
MVSSGLKDDVVRSLWRGGVRELKTFIEDVQAQIDATASPTIRSGIFDYNVYNTIDRINQWVTETATAYATATEGVLGTSYEGRPIKYIKISSGGSKKAVVMHGGIHAREWLSPATVMYLAKYLVEGDVLATDLLTKFDFYIIPVLNVDGYAYSMTNDRLWRKTRSLNTGTSCVGTDPNRNFDIDWGDLAGSSSNPCSQTYHGSGPFSEVEIAALRDFVISLDGGTNNEHGGNVAMYIDYHTYSQLWLYPFGYKRWRKQRKGRAKPSNPGGGGGGGGGGLSDEQLLEAGAAAAVNALEDVHFTEYELGDIFTTIYQVSGDSADYMYDVQNVKFAYGTEGRDTGSYGFIAPEDEIQPSGEENWAALQAICNYVFDNI